MNRTDHKVLSRIKEIISAQVPEAKVYLYGSRSRGTAGNQSDWDLLILLNKSRVTLEDEQKITDPLYDLEFSSGEVISPIIYSEEEWNKKYSITPFFKNVMGEARLL